MVFANYVSAQDGIALNRIHPKSVAMTATPPQTPREGGVAVPQPDPIGGEW